MEITTYTGSDGKETPIADLNHFHLVNALLKVAGKIAMAKELESTPELMPTLEALKAEVLKRLHDK